MKIGFTKNHPTWRAEQLTRTKRMRHELLWATYTENVREVERAVHSTLAEKHVVKEYFRVDFNTALEVITETAISCDLWPPDEYWPA